MTRFLLVSLLAIALPATPSVAEDTLEPAASSTPRDVSLPPALDRVLRAYERAWRARDAAALAALFAEDGFVLQGNRPPSRGHAAIQAAYANQGGSALRLRALAFASDDTIGYIIGAYGYGDDRTDAGKFTLTLRRKPGERWLIFSDMDNSNAPPTRAAPAAPAVVP